MTTSQPVSQKEGDQVELELNSNQKSQKTNYFSTSSGQKQTDS